MAGVPTTWVVLADEGRARILQRRQRGADLEEVEELSDAAARAQNADLRRDAHGRRGAGGTGAATNSTESAGEEKLDHEAELFARRLAAHLCQALREKRYERLRLAAAPRFLGRLRKQLDAEVQKCVVDELDKDLLQLDRRALTLKLYPEDGAANGR